MKPLISIVIPAYNEEECVEELITRLRKLFAAEVGYIGNLVFDTDKPDGTPRKLMDTTKINNLGWKPSITLKEGIKRTIAEVTDNF